MVATTWRRQWKVTSEKGENGESTCFLMVTHTFVMAATWDISTKWRGRSSFKIEVPREVPSRRRMRVHSTPRLDLASLPPPDDVIASEPVQTRPDHTRPISSNN